MRNRRKIQAALTALVFVASAAFPHFTDSAVFSGNVCAVAGEPEFQTMTLSDDGKDYLIITGAENVGEELVIPSEIDGTAVRAVSANAFENNQNIKSLVISEGVAQIDDYVFSGCSNLENVTIPDTVTKVSIRSFLGTKWLREKMKSQEFLIEGNGILLCYNVQSTKKDVEVPSDVTVIAKAAFSGAIFIESVKLGKNVERIEEDAFNECSNLKKINIGSNVKIIGYNAFYSCGFKSISFPKYTKIEGINVNLFRDEKSQKPFPNGVVLRSYSNSSLQMYAENNNLKFEEYYNCYDVDKDCTVDSSDIIYEKNYLAMCSQNNSNEYDADVNENSKANIFDLIRLKNHILSGEAEKDSDRDVYEVYQGETTAPVTTAVTTSAAKTSTTASVKATTAATTSVPKTLSTAAKTTTAATASVPKTSSTAAKTTTAVSTAVTASKQSVTTADSKSSDISGSATAKTSLTGNNKGE